MLKKSLFLSIFFLIGCANSSHDAETRLRQSFDVVYLPEDAPTVERDIRFAIEGIGMEVVEVHHRLFASASEHSWIVNTNHPEYVRETIQKVPGVLKVTPEK